MHMSVAHMLHACGSLSKSDPLSEHKYFLVTLKTAAVSTAVYKTALESAVAQMARCGRRDRLDVSSRQVCRGRCTS
jgi:hypothetical protein